MVGFRPRRVGRVALVPGSNAGPYRIVEPLGRGGMASVYRAYEPKLDRYVALKVLPREFLHDPTFAERFRREAQVVARLEHPNIIPIYAYDIEENDGIPWMAMRLITSGSLAELIRRERLPLARSVAILRGVADALDYAHAKGVVHRDVKPQNVLLDEASRVYLADFGIAKMFEATGGLTASGMITGTPQYMAPEQATGLKIGPPADVYALGIVAYEMFTGKVPFAADTPVAVLMKHVQEPLPLPPPDVVPEPLLRALLRATTKKPEDRWPSAGAFVDALSLGLGTPATARAAAPTAPTVAILPTLPPLAAPTVVSSATAPPPPGRRRRCRRVRRRCARLRLATTGSPRGRRRRGPARSSCGWERSVSWPWSPPARWGCGCGGAARRGPRRRARRRRRRLRTPAPARRESRARARRPRREPPPPRKSHPRGLRPRRDRSPRARRFPRALRSRCRPPPPRRPRPCRPPQLPRCRQRPRHRRPFPRSSDWRRSSPTATPPRGGGPRSSLPRTGRRPRQPCRRS